jgi:hypothetical protein
MTMNFAARLNSPGQPGDVNAPHHRDLQEYWAGANISRSSFRVTR